MTRTINWGGNVTDDDSPFQQPEFVNWLFERTRITDQFRAWMKQGNYSFPQGYEHELSVFKEHGTKWIQDVESGATWAVHEVNGLFRGLRFDFEQVSDGDFDAFYNEQAENE